jgi:heme exporter protein C
MVGLFFSPEDYLQGDSVRIMYVHVPAAWMAMASYAFIAAMSLTAFVWRHSLADLAARAAAGPGAVFTALALFTGSVWGKPTWGAWWVWDARLTSVLVLLFIYLIYIAIWRSMDEQARAARFARIFALFGFINIPIIHFSVEWWNSLHQPASIFRADGPTIHGSMLTPLFAMIIAYTALFIWLVLAGVRADLIRLRLDHRVRRAPSRPIEQTAAAPGGAEGGVHG